VVRLPEPEERGDLVVFDLDGTLTGRDVFREFALRLRPRRQRLYAMQEMGLHFLGKRDNDGLKKTILTRWHQSAKNRKETVDMAVQASVDSAFPHMVDWLTGYQKQGYKVVVATASPRFLAAPVLDRLGLDGIVLVAAEGRWENNELHYRSCYGQAKLDRLRSAYPDLELGLVVSDSESDRPALSAAKAEVMVSGGVRTSARGCFPGMER
jgi:HAD superfamily phosphoserine phosphatase-like hydrolase